MVSSVNPRPSSHFKTRDFGLPHCGLAGRLYVGAAAAASHPECPGAPSHLAWHQPRCSSARRPTSPASPRLAGAEVRPYAGLVARQAHRQRCPGLALHAAHLPLWAGLLALGSRCGTKVDAAAAIARASSPAFMRPLRNAFAVAVQPVGVLGATVADGLPDRCVAGLSQPRRVGVDVKRRASCSELRALVRRRFRKVRNRRSGPKNVAAISTKVVPTLPSARQCSAYRLVPATISAAVMPARKRALHAAQRLLGDSRPDASGTPPRLRESLRGQHPPLGE